MTPAIEIRRGYRPGDYGAIVALHGRLYSPEYGVDSSFEAHVAAGVGRAALRGYPREREGLWVVERDGEFAGCLGLTDEDGVTGMVRWFVLDPALRGRGLGRELIGELVDRARDLDYERLELETFSDLRTAAKIYRAHGFELISEQVAPRWGRDPLTYQHYALELAPAESEPATQRVAGSA